MKPTLLAFLLTALTAVPAYGQPADPHAMRDSLAAIADTAVLRGIADAAAHSGSSMDQLRRGFAALRLFELTHAREAAEQARSAFERARDLAPDDGFAALGLGLALAALAEADDASPPTIVAGRAFERALGLDARSRARRALERALEAEPALAEAADALARVALATHDTEALRAALAALVRVTGGPDASARSWVARARVSLALGDPAGALSAADAALAIDGLRPEALHARAIALLRTPGREAEGARVYFEAARNASAETAAALRAEILELTTPAERARFDTLSPAGRVDFLETFWDVRAGLAGVSMPARIAEHYRRLAIAFERYQRQAHWGAVPTNALLRDRPEGRFDDRGVMLIRHGEPLDAVRTIERDLGRNESWLYVNAAGEPFMAHFFEYGDFSDYVLIYNVPCASEWVADRVGYDARMNVLRHRCSSFDRRSVSYEIRRDVYDALATDSHHPDFTADLPFTFDMHTFRGPAGSTEVLVSTTVSAGLLSETADSTGTTLRALDLSVAIVDTAAATLVRAGSRTTARDEELTTYLLLAPEPADQAAVRVVARDVGNPLAGRLRGSGLRIPSYEDDTLMVSDVLLAAPAEAHGADADAAWQRAGRSIGLAPSAPFDSADFRVFAEIYNLEAGQSYTTELSVSRTGGGIGRMIRGLFGGNTSVRLRFEETAAPDPDGAVRILRDVRSDLEPGSYRLTLRITFSDRTIERTRTLTIRDEQALRR